MIVCKTKIDENKIVSQGVMATCPFCGQKLTEVSHINGSLVLRIKCRRCRRFISVDISEKN